MIGRNKTIPIDSLLQLRQRLDRLPRKSSERVTQIAAVASRTASPRQPSIGRCKRFRSRTPRTAPTTASRECCRKRSWSDIAN